MLTAQVAQGDSLSQEGFGSSRLVAATAIGSVLRRGPAAPLYKRPRLRTMLDALNASVPHSVPLGHGGVNRMRLRIG